MNDILQAAVQLRDFCKQRRWPFCLIGGLAAIRWGEPRATQDVDISLLVDFGDEARFADELLECYAARRADARAVAIDHRVLVLRSPNGTPLDVAFAALPYEQRMMARATDYDFAPGVALPTASAEDIVIQKAFAGRHQDWHDVQRIIDRRGELINWTLIFEELEQLREVADDPLMIDKLQAMRKT
jgi:hypothetical protein